MPADDTAQSLGDDQWVNKIAGDTPGEDQLELTDRATGARIVVDHRSWPALVAAIDHFRIAHCEAAGCSEDPDDLSTPTLTLFAPSVRIMSTGESQFDAMTTWRAELEMAVYDHPGDCPDVLVGYAEFLVIRVLQQPIAELLDSLSATAEHFSILFDDDDVSDIVADEFSDAMPFNRILIITEVSIAEPVRGHDLGAYLVAELIPQLAGEIDTLVLMYPFPDVHQTEDAAELEAVNKLTNYWQRAGLAPIEAHPEFLGQSTAYTALPAARRALLQRVEHLVIAVPEDLLTIELPGWVEPRCTFTDRETGF